MAASSLLLSKPREPLETELIIDFETFGATAAYNHEIARASVHALISG